MADSKLQVCILPGTPVPVQAVEPLRERLEAADFDVHVAEFVQPFTSIEASRAWLLHWLADRDLTAPALVGHSFGAYRAFDLALNSDLDIHSIVAIGAVAGIDEEFATQIEPAAQMVREGANVASMMADRWFTAEFRRREPGAILELAAWYDASDNDLWAAQLLEYRTAISLEERLPEIDVPVYLLTGELDLATPPSWAHAIAERLPDCVVEIAPSVGHFVFAEDLRACDNAVAFLSG